MAKRSQLFMLPLSESRPPSRLSALLLILIAFYSPFAWIVLRVGPWDAKRLLWLKSWPALPGFIVRSLDVFDGRPVWTSYAAMGTLAFIVLVALLRIARISWPWLVVAMLLAAGFSSWNSWFAFQSW